MLKLDPDHSDARVGLRKGKRFDGDDHGDDLIYFLPAD